jgi:hypothetical protein
VISYSTPSGASIRKGGGRSLVTLRSSRVQRHADRHVPTGRFRTRAASKVTDAAQAAGAAKRGRVRPYRRGASSAVSFNRTRRPARQGRCWRCRGTR